MFFKQGKDTLLGSLLVVMVFGGVFAPIDVFSQEVSGETRFEIIDGTRVFYRVREQLVGVSFLNDAVGVSEGISGAIVVDADGMIDASQSRLVFDLATFSSDQARRDNFVRTRVFEIAQARGCRPDCILHEPEAVFIPRMASNSPLPPDDIETSFPIIGFELSGDLTLHGVTQEITWEILATYNNDAGIVEGKAQTKLMFSMFDLTKPDLAFLLTVEDEIRLEIDFKATIK
jgi:hypothetical protein